jgi:hypothetical protein
VKDLVLLSISPDGYFVYFSLFAGICLLLSVVIYLLLGSGRFRRSHYSGLGSVSKRKASIVAAVFFLVSLVYFYMDSWSYFYTLKVEESSVEVGYVFPERYSRIPFSDISSLQASSHIRKGGTKYRLVIQTTDGEEYASQLLRKDELERVESALNDHFQS